jgi:membrane fusion protein, macrolide-specific efflux system
LLPALTEREASEDLVAQFDSPAAESGRGDSDGRQGLRGSRLSRRQRSRRLFFRPRSLVSWPGVTLPLAVLVAGGSVGAWLATRSPASASPSYIYAPVVRTTMRQALSSSGTISPATTSTLSFGAQGQVTAVDATVGENVTQGETLATMASATLQAQVAQAEATLAGDQARLSQDEDSGASSAQIAADQATVNVDQSQLDTANAALSGATLTAPIDGIVTTVGYTVGEQVSGGGGGGDTGNSGDTGSNGNGSSGDTGNGNGDTGNGDTGNGDTGSSPSITVVSANDVIDASVAASVVDKIKTGDQVVISSEGATASGTVASIGLIADTSSGVATFPVVIDVTGTPSGLYSGASATVSIIYNQLKDVLAVPAAAVQTSPSGKHFVDAVVNGRQVPRDVTTGLTSGGLTQITSGLTAGERVVEDIPKFAVPGSPGNLRGPLGGRQKIFFSGPGGGGGVVVQGGG